MTLVESLTRRKDFERLVKNGYKLIKLKTDLTPMDKGWTEPGFVYETEYKENQNYGVVGGSIHEAKDGKKGKLILVDFDVKEKSNGTYKIIPEAVEKLKDVLSVIHNRDYYFATTKTKGLHMGILSNEDVGQHTTLYKHQSCDKLKIDTRAEKGYVVAIAPNYQIKNIPDLFDKVVPDFEQLMLSISFIPTNSKSKENDFNNWTIDELLEGGWIHDYRRRKQKSLYCKLRRTRKTIEQTKDIINPILEKLDEPLDEDEIKRNYEEAEDFFQTNTLPEYGYAEEPSGPFGNRNQDLFDYLKEYRKINPNTTKETLWDITKLRNADNPQPLDERELRIIFNSNLKYDFDLQKKVEDDTKLSEYAELIMKDYKFKTLDDTHEILYYDNGAYVSNGETLIAEECEKLIPDCSKYKTNEVTAIIQRRTFTNRKLFNNDFSRLVFDNGLLNLDTFELSPFDPDFLTTVKIPIKYDPKTIYPKNFIKFLKDCLEPHAVITVIEEIANILNFNRKNFEISAMWTGDGANGKSTLFNIIEGVFGSENFSHVSIHSMQDNRFAIARLDGKIGNIHKDISKDDLDNLGPFKQAVSQEILPAEKKNKDPFDIKPFAKHFFSANEMPKIKDDSDGAFRRIYVTKWGNQFLAGVNRIEDYDKLILKEKSAIFNMILENYKSLLRNKGFRYKQSIAEVREIIKNESDKLREFIIECFDQDPNGWIIKKDLFQIYSKFSDSKHYEVLSMQKIGARLPQYGFKDGSKKIKNKTERIWLGFKLKKDSDWVKTNIGGLDSYA